MGFDLLIRNVQTRSSGQDLVDIAVRAGRIVEICAALVTESFVNGHLRL
jgi:hypothetical protein